MTVLRTAGLLLCGVLLACRVSAEEVSAREWLERMSMAGQSLNYSGTFVYQHQGHLETMRIVHVMDDDGERERLVSLTGPRREVLRDNQVVTCILGDRQAVHVNRSRPRTPFPMSFPTELMTLERHYNFELQGEGRVAGRDCRMVSVKPRDSLRYGRRLCVHEDSHLLLRSELTSAGGESIEQVMFTEVEFPDAIDETALLPDLSDAGYSWQREPEPAHDAATDLTESGWVIGQVPTGFMLTDHRWHQLSANEPGVEHWVYSDGLASVSVYIEKARSRDTYSGTSHRGALNAFGTMVNGYYITVVGEVPRETVEMIGRSVHQESH